MANLKDAAHDRERYVGDARINNWRINEGEATAGSVPKGQVSRQIMFVEGVGYGGVSMITSESFGKAEIHLELDDAGLHLMVYVQSVASGEPILNAFVRSDGLAVQSLTNSTQEEHHE
jgi:hypothetical protein